MPERKAYGFIHCHTDHSIQDSPLKIDDLIDGAVSMGATAVSITDHGSGTGMVEFYDKCKKKGIKPILGVEAYLETEYAKRAHLILLAKNYQGYQEICKAISMSNGNIQTAGKLTFPIMTKEILTECFGKDRGKEVNVIATSACIGGVLAVIPENSTYLETQIRKKKKKQSRFHSPDDPEYKEKEHQAKQLEEEVLSLKSECTGLKQIAEKKYTLKKRSLRSLKVSDPEAYRIQKKALEKEEEESIQAAKELPKKKALWEKKKKELQAVNRFLKAEKSRHIKYMEYQQEIEQLESSQMTEQEVTKNLIKEMGWFWNLFHGNFFVEVQYHGLNSEKRTFPILADLADRYHVPLLATNDVHIRRKEDAIVRSFINALRFEEYEEPTKDQKELYLKTDNELRSSLRKILKPDQVERAMKNIQTVCDICNCEIPDQTYYPKYRNDDGTYPEDPALTMRQKALANIPNLYQPGEWDEKHQKRFEYEYEVISSMGYADYHLCVADYINKGKEYAKQAGYGIGYGIGPGRGSAAGSLICYLLGITAIEPLKYDLLFERFLNPSRVSMPDIDIDFSNEVREPCIDYIRKKYGNQTVAGIRTTITQGGKSALRNVARVYGWTQSDKKKEYQIAGDKLANEFDPSNGSLSEQKDFLLSVVPGRYSRDILDIAPRCEGVINALGVHAAGKIIGDGCDLRMLVPVLYNTRKKEWAVQCDMVESERMGMLKMDFLGLITLDVITKALRLIEAGHYGEGKRIDPDHLPFEPEVFQSILASGETEGVFQFESGGMKQMLREFKPETFEDLILLVACYRPGPMQYLTDEGESVNVIKIKNGQEQPSYLIPELEPILKDTYCGIIYQEQVMQIFQSLAGYSLGDADLVRRAMSKKKVKVLEAERKAFLYGDRSRKIKGCVANGINEKKANELFDQMMDFASYAFNKSHAACYAYVAYITAWLKYHYPVEFMTAFLSYTEVKKLPQYLYECKRMGISILTPDVNLSNEDFSIKEDQIVFGLSSIKGIKSNGKTIIDERKENGPYTDFFDFIRRNPRLNRSVVESLIRCGAFSSIHKGQRASLLLSFEQIQKDLKTIGIKTALIEKLEIEKEQAPDAKERKKIERRIENAKKRIRELNEFLHRIEFSYQEDESEFLADEKELLGTYISGSPLDAYKSSYEKKDIILLPDLSVGYVKIIGMITDLRIAKRKKDGKPMGFFRLEDITGMSVDVSCFTEKYAKYKDLIIEDTVVEIYGKCKEEVDSYSNEKEFKILPTSIKTVYRTLSPLVIGVVGAKGWNEHALPYILKHRVDHPGRKLILHDESNPYAKEQYVTSQNGSYVYVKEDFYRSYLEDRPEFHCYILPKNYKG